MQPAWSTLTTPSKAPIWHSPLTGMARRASGCGGGARGDPFCAWSTDYVFDGRKSAPYIESDQPAPLSVYGKSKLAGEEAVLAAHSSAVIVRTSWVFGPDGKSFLTTMLNLAKAQDVIPVVADQRGSPTAVSDFAQALIAISRHALAGGTGSRSGIYHVSGGGEATWFTFAHAIFSGWARRGFRVPRIEPILLADWNSPARRPLDSRLDCSKQGTSSVSRCPIGGSRGTHP